VKARGGRDDDGLDGGIREKLRDVAETLRDSELIGKPVGRARRRIGDGDEIGVGQAAGDGFGVERADPASSDEREAKGFRGH